MKALVLVSGGLDSTTCLAECVEKYGNENVVALSIFYGQKHKKEIEAAEAVTNYYKVEWLQQDLNQIFKYSNCSLLENSTEEIPKETYAKQLENNDGMPVSTYVPFRNGLFLASAASIGLAKDCQVIYYGAHHDDAAGNAYPDCSKAFTEAMNEAIVQGSGSQIRLEVPYVNLAKKDIVKRGLKLKVPYELTWSCYEGGEKACGLCATCIDRIKAFEDNDCKDPILYNNI